MKTKNFTLISEYGKEWYWYIFASIREDGSFETKGKIRISNNRDSYNKRKEYFKIRYSKNKKYSPKRNKEYYEKHKEDIKKRNKKYREMHREKVNERNRKYSKTENGKKIEHRKSAKRREKGFVELNEPLDGIKCNAHHINQNDVVYIPRSSHISYPHNLNKPDRNLDIVNSIAYAEIYLYKLKAENKK